MMSLKSPHLKRLGDLILKGIVVLCVAWTFFSATMLLWKQQKFHTAPQQQNIGMPAVTLPVISSDLLYHNLPGIAQALARLESVRDVDRRPLGQPVRVGVIFNGDSACFVESTYVADCACPASKIDRFEIIHDAIDPVTGIKIAQYKEENLSAERVTKYFGGLTQIWRIQ